MTSRTNNYWGDAELHLSTVDEKLAGVIRTVGPCGMSRKPNTFSSLAESIVHQQLSLKASRTIFKRVENLCGGRTLTAERLAAAPDEKLRGAGLSRSKVVYLRDLAAHVLDGRLKLRSLANRSDQEVIDRLTAVKGIGQWSAEMYLMFVLNRPDVFSAGDLGLRNAVKRLYRADVSAPRMKKRIESWAPFRSVASWYLWASLHEDIIY